MKQLDLLESIAEMEAGIQQAVDNANSKSPKWSDEAIRLLREYLMCRPTPFRCEEFRIWCEGRLAQPPHDRAFGGVIRRAVMSGLIKFAGYDKTENPKAHRAHCSLWQGMDVAV